MVKYKVNISGVDTNNLEQLSSDEMRELFIKYHNGDNSARNRLIESNLKLVLSILKRFNNHNNVNLDDLFQIGCVGLIKAIDNFDLSYNVKFSTYAHPMILGEIKRYIRDNLSIRVSRSLKDTYYKLIKLKEEYYTEYGEEPSVDYLMNKLDVSELDISNAEIALREPVSMYEAIYNDGGDTIYLYDQIEDKKQDNDYSNKIIIDNAINSLVPRERYILNERFNIGKSQMEIAEELDISQAQVSRIEKKAVKTLKKILK